MDSGNILSILAALGQAPAPAPDLGITPTTYQPLPDPGPAPITNVLQAVAPPAPTSDISAQIANMPAPQAAPATTPEKPRSKRPSVIEIIGRLADTVATVGGAQPQYQPTLDAARNRATDIDMDALKIALARQQVAGGAQEVEATERKRIGTALGALAGRENAADLWPSIAEQAGIDPQKAAAIGQIIQANPDAAGIFARSLGADIDNLGKNVYFGAGPDGKTVAYQVGEDGRPHILDFSESGITPSDPMKVVNTGGATVVLDSRGNPRKVLPNTEAPGRAADRATRIQIAGMRPGAAGKGGSADPAMVETAQASLNELRQIYGNLKNMGAMVSPAQSNDKNVVARIRASGIGQVLEGAVGTEAQTERDRINSIRPGLMQSLAKATGMTGKQLDSNADVKLFMQTVTDPTKSYEANMKAIDGLERFLRANVKKPQAAPAKPKASAGGWSIVKVQ